MKKCLSAWNTGLVDALVTYEPLAGQLREQGATVIFDSRQARNLIVDVLAVREDRLHWPHAGALRGLLPPGDDDLGSLVDDRYLPAVEPR